MTNSGARRIAIITAIETHNMLGNRTVPVTNYSIGTPISNTGSYHTEVNTLLAGTMMISLTFLVVGLCVFLHQKFKKEPGAVSLHTLPWTDENLEVFTLSGQEEVTGMYLPPPTPSPPPAYESVVKLNEKDEVEVPEKSSLCAIQDTRDDKFTLEDDDLPTYDAAMKLGAQGYL